MSYLRLICWNAAEAEEKAARLRAWYKVDQQALTPGDLRKMRDDPPLAVVIDLSRLPSHGRDVALGIRQYKATRQVPLVFVDGEPEKVSRIRQLLPDAVYTSWPRIRGALKQAVANRPVDPVVPESRLVGYSGTPLPKKLGIRENCVVALVDAPENFEKTLGDLPDGARLRREATGARDLCLWFVRSRRDLERRIPRMAAQVGEGAIWIVWPKKTSALAGDLGQAEVRAAGLEAGLVDYKVCAVDATWSGLLFTRRKAK